MSRFSMVHCVGWTNVQKALISRVLSSEWKVFRIRLAVFLALCTIPATCLSNFNYNQYFSHSRAGSGHSTQTALKVKDKPQISQISTYF